MNNPWLVSLAVGSALLISGLVWWRSVALPRRSVRRVPPRRRKTRRDAPEFVSPPAGWPQPDPEPEVLRQVVILFGAESAFLTGSGLAALDEAARRLADRPTLTVTIEGSADSTGNPSRNLVLARDRAWVARQYLLGKGIAADRIRSVVLPPRAGGTEYERRRLRSVRLTWQT
jgi:outer membrane protein OmpA-like peptidoglycan-associated protein